MSASFRTNSGLGSLLIAHAGGSVAVKVRQSIAYACDPERGLLAEVRSGAAPKDRIPWADAESRRCAIEQLEAGPVAGLTEEEQRAALDHVRRTAYYE